MPKNKLLEQHTEGLSPEAKAEVERIWKQKETNPMIHDITLPLLCLYCGAWSQARELTLKLDIDSDEEGYDYDDTLARLEKIQKLVIAYAKLLKLDEKPNKASKNKFYTLLTK